MNLAAPWLLLLLPLPLVLRRLIAPVLVPRAALTLPPHLYSAARPAVTARQRGPLLAALAWCTLVIALAGPRIEISSDVIPASGRDIVLAIDLSGSMLKEDFRLNGDPVTRLEAVKRSAVSFVAARRGDRIGLVIFGERAYFAAPLTFDVDAVARAIEEAQIGISGRGTAISDGLGLATKRLAQSDAPTRVVVLLSDGVDTSGTVPAIEAARLAHDHGIRIHSIALGPEDLENQPQSRDAVDVATLRAVAEAAGGESFRVRNTQDLQALGHSLDRLEPSPAARPPMKLWQPLWVWPAALAALCLMLLSGRRRGWAG